MLECTSPRRLVNIYELVIWEESVERVEELLRTDDEKSFLEIYTYTTFRKRAEYL